MPAPAMYTLSVRAHVSTTFVLRKLEYDCVLMIFNTGGAPIGKEKGPSQMDGTETYAQLLPALSQQRLSSMHSAGLNAY